MTPGPRQRRLPDLTRAPIWLRCLATGLALVAAVPPWGWWPLGIVGIALLDGLIADQPRAVRFRRTWLTCAVWLSIGMFWMWDLTPPGYVVAFTAYAAYFGVAAMLVPPGPGRRLALPGAIALAEGVRWAFPFGGVPLATIPHGQVGGPLVEVVRVAGPLLLVMVTVVAGQALAAAVRREHRAGTRGTAVVVLAVLLAAVAPVPEALGELDVALVQGGGPQRTRDSRATRPIVFQRHLDASDTIDRPVDLVLWPENVVRGDDDYDHLAQLSDLARRLDTTLVVGVVESVPDGRFHNHALVIGPDGELGDRYDKVRRVPFGEITPFRSLLERIAGDTIVSSDAIPGTGPAVVDTEHGPMAVAISWEVFFAGRVREGVERGGEVVLNPTNGASYWLTMVQTQQVASSRLRALETGRWVLQAAPTGFTAVVDPDGQVLERTRISEQAVIVATVERRTGDTWAVVLGDRVPFVGAALLVAAGWAVALGWTEPLAARLRSRRGA